MYLCERGEMRGARRGRARRMMECIVKEEKATRWVWRALARERIWRWIGGFVGSCDCDLDAWW